MRFHKISPCPRCDGRIRPQWERDEYGVRILAFTCLDCHQTALLRAALVGQDRSAILDQAIRQWNMMRNGAHQYRQIYKSLGGRR